jgi:hypothetical protein
MKILSKLLCSIWSVTLLVLLNVASPLGASGMSFPTTMYGEPMQVSVAYDGASLSGCGYDFDSAPATNKKENRTAGTIDELPIFRKFLAAESGAHSPIQARNLAHQLTTEEQMAQALAGKGEPIFGAGTSKPLTSGNRLRG